MIKINSFISCLNQTNIKNNYISTLDSNTFQVINDKDLKKLKTAQIVEIAEKTFDSIAAESTLNLEERKAKRTELIDALRVFSRRLYQSKKWYEKIAHFFGFKSQEEKKLNLLIPRVNHYNEISEMVRNHKRNYDLQLFYHKTGENSQNIAHLNGLPFNVSMVSIIEDLKTFKDITDSPIAKQLIEALEFASAIDKKSSKDQKTSAAEVFQKVNNLPTPKPGEKSFTIEPGGCKGHAAVYLIERKRDGSFSFYIINTGDGRSPLEYLTALDQEGVAHPSDQLAKDNEWLTACYEFKNLTLNELSEDFFANLTDFNINCPDMSVVNKFIDEKLKKEDNYHLHISHLTQNHGTCSMQCLLALIDILLDVTHAKNFKIHMFNRAIDQFDNNPKCVEQAKKDPNIAALRKDAGIMRDKLINK